MPEVVVSDGLRMSYRRQGAGPVLLLVHGWGVHGGFFEPQFQALSGSFDVIAPDLRGHGGSPARADQSISVEQLAADLTGFLQALDLRSVLAVGWSMGAMVLWRACLSGAASRFLGLVVEDMSPRIVNADGWKLGMKGGYDAEAAEAAQRAMLGDWPGFARVLARSLFTDPSDKGELIAEIEREVAAQDPAPLARLWGSLAEQDFRERLRSISLPTLIIDGGAGLYHPETGRFLQRALPDAERLSFPASGHAPHLEEPEAFNRALADFHHRLTAPAKPAASAAH